jgi:pimeloyl-ACP methyl ester carboxylesterase
VIDAIKAQAVGPVVLVGHSMGGRVAMHVADLAKDSGLLAAVVIEDMDVTERPGPHPAVSRAKTRR